MQNLVKACREAGLYFLEVDILFENLSNDFSRMIISRLIVPS